MDVIDAAIKKIKKRKFSRVTNNVIYDFLGKTKRKKIFCLNNDVEKCVSQDELWVDVLDNMYTSFVFEPSYENLKFIYYSCDLCVSNIVFLRIKMIICEAV